MADTITKDLIYKEDISHWDGVSATGTRKTSTGGTQTLNKLDWAGIDVFATQGARTGAAIADAAANIGATNHRVLFLSDGDWELSANVSLGANIYIRPAPGARFTQSASETLTVYSPDHILASPRQQITAVDMIAFTDPDGIWYPDRYGIDGTNDHTEVEYAVTAARRVHITQDLSFGGVVTPPSNTEIYIPKGVTITHAASTATNMFDVSSTSGVTIHGGGVLDGNRANQSGTTVELNCIVFGDTSVDDLTIEGLELKNAHSSGIWLEDANDIFIRHNYIHGCGYTSGSNPATGAGTTPGGVNVRNTSYRFEITNNTIDDNWTGIRFQSTSFYDVRVSNSEIKGNIRTGFAATASGGSASRVSVTGNVFRDNGDDAVWLYEVDIGSVSGNVIESWISGGNGAGYEGGYGIELRECDSVAVTGNAIQTVANAGIGFRGCKYCNATANTIVDSQTHGIIITDSTNDGLGTHGQENSVIGNIVTGCEANGVRIHYSDYGSVHGNIVKDNGEGAATTGGIFLLQSTYNHVIGNKLRNGGVQEPGIEESTGGDYNVIESNYTHGHTTEISVTGSNTVVRSNEGYATKNDGSSSIASGTTSIAVTHGLDVTPSAEHITVIGKENPTNSVGTIWVDTIGASQFTVNVENDPGASNWDFGWKADTE